MTDTTMPDGCKPCVHCSRPVRPYETKVADYPGTIRPGARGLCQTCHLKPEIRALYGPKVWPGQELMDEVDMLLSSGRPAREIPDALGLLPSGLSQAAYRNGRVDLARLFGRMRDRSQAVANRRARRRAARLGLAA